MIKIFLWGVINLILVKLISVLVKVEFIIKLGIVWVGLVVLNGIVFLVIKDNFIMIFVRLDWCFLLLNLFLNNKVVINIVNGGIIFLVIIVVIIIELLFVIVVVRVFVLKI